mmetsp:Transcript_731/g.2696  ORF Transcript_731/g.2696 Transcript_731/m.2696 type:complete len:313 (+) Transcript_731:473-1411(+)
MADRTHGNANAAVGAAVVGCSVGASVGTKIVGGTVVGSRVIGCAVVGAVDGACVGLGVSAVGVSAIGAPVAGSRLGGAVVGCSIVDADVGRGWSSVGHGYAAPRGAAHSVPTGRSAIVRTVDHTSGVMSRATADDSAVLLGLAASPSEASPAASKKSNASALDETHLTNRPSSSTSRSQPSVASSSAPAAVSAVGSKASGGASEASSRSRVTSTSTSPRPSTCAVCAARCCTPAAGRAVGARATRDEKADGPPSTAGATTSVAFPDAFQPEAPEASGEAPEASGSPPAAPVAAASPPATTTTPAGRSPRGGA